MARQAKKVLRNIKQRTPYAEPSQEITVNNQIITISSGTVLITKATAATGIVLDDPPADVDGLVLRIISTTAAAHTITNASGSGFNGGGAGSDVATFGAAALNQFTLLAHANVWRVIDNVNVTLA